MKNTNLTFKQFSTAVFVCFFALMAQGVWANWSLDMVSGSVVQGKFMEGSYIKGISTDGAVQIYLTTDDKAIQALTFLLERPSNATWKSVEWEDVLQNDAGKALSSLTAAKTLVKIDAGPGTTALPANTRRVLVGTVYYTLNEVIQGSLALSFDKIQAATAIPAADYKAKVSVTGPSALSLLEAFNFATIDDNPFEMDEDDEPLTIDAADTDHFEASAWNGTAIVATTDVKFIEAWIASNNDPGSVEVTDDKIVYTPKADFYGEVVIGYKACSTDASITSKVEDELTINVAPVNDAPVVTIGEVAGKEGEKLSFSIEYSDDATAWEDVTAKVVTFNGVELAGTWEGFAFTSTESLSYDLVAHPNKFAEYALKVAITDNGKGGAAPETGSDETTCEVEDVDREPEYYGVAIFVSLDEAKVTDTVTASVSVPGSVVDPDGDAITYRFAWFKDDVSIGEGETLDIAETDLKKDDEATVKVWGTTRPYGEDVVEQEITGTTFTVINSAPVANPTSYSLFIQKEEGQAGGSKDLTLNATDADDDELTLTNVSKPESGWTVDIDGNVATFTTNSAVELTDQVFTFKFNDGEADSETITVTVNFRQDPPPVFGEFTTEGTPKEAEEEPWVVTTSVADSNTAVEPSGIKSVTWTLCDVNGAPLADYYTAVVEYSADGQTWSATMPQVAGDAVLYTRCSYLFDYDFIEHPAYKKDIKVFVTAVDGNGASQNASTDATVEDTDRAPTAPANIIMQPQEPLFGSTITATANGSQDADGDDFTYIYTWYYSEDGGQTFIDVQGSDNTLTSNTAILKGNVVKVSAKANTVPYEGSELVVPSEGSAEETVTVGNTAPVITKIGSDAIPQDAESEYTFYIPEQDTARSVASPLIFGSDVDKKIDSTRDSLTWEVDPIDEAYGSVEIGNLGGGLHSFRYIVKAHYSNNGVDMPYTYLNLKDESSAYAINKVKIWLLAGQVNEKPVVKAEDQYVLPDERGVEQTATFEVNMGVNEDDQEVKDAVISECIDEAGIFDGQPTVAFEGKNVTLTYKIKADAELGKSATITLKAQDNGQTFNNTTKVLVDDPLWSDDVTITVFVGSSPWYPIISFDCVEPESHVDGHTFHLVAGNDVYDLTVKGANDTLMPADYAAAGVPGFQDNTEIDVTVYVWTMEEGTTETVCAEKKVTVSEYGLPGAATCAEESVEADVNGWVTLPDISVPMASSYIMTILDVDGNEVQVLAGDFTPDANGIILPVISGQTLQIPESGNYTVSVMGINPNGEGPDTQVLTIVVPENGEVVVEWTGDEFLPEDGRVLTTDAVKLSWPVATNAESYTVRIYGPDGKLLEMATGLFETNYITTKTTAEENAQNYTWYVSAIRDGEVALASEFHNFTLATTTKSVIPDGVTVYGPTSLSISFQGILEEDAVVKVDCLYYSCTTNKVTDNIALVADTSTAGQLIVTLTNEVAANDYVVLYIYVNDELCGEGAAYLVQEAILIP